MRRYGSLIKINPSGEGESEHFIQIELDWLLAHEFVGRQRVFVEK